MTTVALHTLPDTPSALLDFLRRTQQNQDPVGAFLASPEWLELMAGAPAAVSLLAASNTQGVPVVALPWIARPWALVLRLPGGRRWTRTLRTAKVGGGDLVEAGADAADLREVLRTLFQREPGVEALWFEHLADPRRRDLLTAAARGSGCAFALRLFTDLPHYRLHLPPTRDAAFALRSAKSHSRLRSKQHALERETGQALRLVEIRTPTDWEPYAARIERLMNASWQAALLGQAFSLDSVRGTALRGWLRGFLLLAGEEAVAFTLYYQGMDTLVSAVLGYDRRFARFSPGAILFQLTLEQLYTADTPRYLDFGEGDADYKRQWANEVRQVSALMLVRNRAGLVVATRLFQLQRALVRGGRALLRRLQVERLLVRRLKRGGGADDAD